MAWLIFVATTITRSSKLLLKLVTQSKWDLKRYVDSNNVKNTIFQELNCV